MEGDKRELERQRVRCTEVETGKLRRVEVQHPGPTVPLTHTVEVDGEGVTMINVVRCKVASV